MAQRRAQKGNAGTRGNGGNEKTRRAVPPGFRAPRKTRASADAIADTPEAIPGTETLASASSGTPGTEETGMVGQEPVTETDGLAEMLVAADGSALADQPQGAPQVPAVLTDPLPGMCMGVSVFISLGLHKVGFDGLTEKEAEVLTASLLRTMQAFEIRIADPRVAAVVDLGGCMVGILVPRIVADMATRKKKSEMQEQVAERIEPDAAAT